MLRRSYWLLIGTAFLAAAGCGSHEALIKKQAEFNARLDQMVQANAATNARLAELANELMELQNQVKSASVEMEVLKPGYKELKSSLAEISQKLEAPPPVPAPKIEIVSSETAQKEKDATPQDAYMRAFGLYSANNYQQAIEAFETFLRTFPASEYAANAQYWLGECYYSQRNFPQALDAFTRVVTIYPKSGKVPDAMLKIGYTHISMNEQSKAKAVLHALIEKYPKSLAAAKARERLNQK